MVECSEENDAFQKVGDCKFCIQWKEQAAGDCEFCQINLLLNIDGCSCNDFQSEYKTEFFIRGNTGKSDLESIKLDPSQDL